MTCERLGCKCSTKREGVSAHISLGTSSSRERRRPGTGDTKILSGISTSTQKQGNREPQGPRIYKGHARADASLSMYAPRVQWAHSKMDQCTQGPISSGVMKRLRPLMKEAYLRRIAIRNGKLEESRRTHSSARWPAPRPTRHERSALRCVLSPRARPRHIPHVHGALGRARRSFFWPALPSPGPSCSVAALPLCTT